MTTDETTRQLLNAVNEIRDYVRLLAEPAIAERDQRLRAQLRRVVGKSARGAMSVLLMDGNRSQTVIQREAGIDKGQLSTLVKQLRNNNLLTGDAKQPKLAISIPANFFENGTRDD